MDELKVISVKRLDVIDVSRRSEETEKAITSFDGLLMGIFIGALITSALFFPF